MNRKCDFCNDAVAQQKQQNNQQVKYVKYCYTFIDNEATEEGYACFDCYEFITANDDQIKLVK